MRILFAGTGVELDFAHGHNPWRFDSAEDCVAFFETNYGPTLKARERLTAEGRCRDDGLIVIGLHTPEFLFEHDLDLVRHDTAERAIDYPVAGDNDNAIWSPFANHYWPALYFVDVDGILRDQHFGEGRYLQRAGEAAMRALHWTRRPARDPQPTTTMRCGGAALHGDDGARLRLLLSHRSEREVGA